MIDHTLTQAEQLEHRRAALGALRHPRTGWGFYRFGGLLGVPETLVAHPGGLPPGWKESNISGEQQAILAGKVIDLGLSASFVHHFNARYQKTEQHRLY